MRPVFNLKPLNVFVRKIHFKMENINTALHTIAPGDLLVSIDLILAFQFLNLIANFCDSSGQIRHEFTCLPFGYSLAPRAVSYTHLTLPTKA